MERNRAISAALNAQIRWTMARLLEEVPKLHKLAQKKVNFSNTFISIKQKNCPSLFPFDMEFPVPVFHAVEWIYNGVLVKVHRSQVKGLSKEELMARGHLVLALQERIEAIPDGIAAATKQSGGWSTSTSHKNIKLNSSGGEITMPFSRFIETFGKLYPSVVVSLSIAASNCRREFQ